MRDTIIKRVIDTKLIAIVRGIEEEKCLQLAEAIYQGGIDLIEITFDQTSTDNYLNTRNAIAAISKHLGKRIAVGAGTVVTPEQVKMAADAGAKYIISPNACEKVIRTTRDLGLVSIPGVLTPTEITAAHEAGADFAKVFPAGVFGSNYIKAMRAPLKHIKMLAVGGVNAENIPEFLNAGCLGFGVGGNLVNKEWIDNGEFDKITETARELCKAVGR